MYLQLPLVKGKVGMKHPIEKNQALKTILDDEDQNILDIWTPKKLQSFSFAHVITFTGVQLYLHSSGSYISSNIGH